MANFADFSDVIYKTDDDFPISEKGECTMC